MSENMKKFLEMVSKDENLKKKMLACNDMESADAIRTGIALAKELGIELTEADFSKNKTGEELNDDELEAVVGGICVCPVAGAGGGENRSGNTYGCACAFYGQGGDGHDEHWNCFCIAGGGGTDGNVW